MSGFHKYPTFKTVGTRGIRPGRLPRWLKLLMKLAAILDLGAQSRLTRTPPPSQVRPPFQLPRRPICPKSTWGVERTASTRWISISVARSRPGGPRWPQVAFLERPSGGVGLAKKSYRTCPKLRRFSRATKKVLTCSYSCSLLITTYSWWRLSEITRGATNGQTPLLVLYTK